jgi:hypothetical protein
MKPSSFTLAILLLTMHGASSEGAAQQPAVIRGRITHRLTGAPLVGAKVAVIGLDGGRSLTDSLGQYRLILDRSGMGWLEINCPSNTGLGPMISIDTRVAAQANRELVLNMAVTTEACTEPPPSAIYGVFRGRYTAGFEHISFEPCLGSTKQPLWRGPHSAPGAWVDFSDAALAQLNASWPKLKDPAEEPTYYAEFRGLLRGPGRFGHMGVSNYQVEVDSLIAFRLAASGDCE